MSGRMVCSVTLLLAAETTQVHDEVDVHLTDAQFASIGYVPGTNGEQTELVQGVTPAIVMLGLEALLKQLKQAHKAVETKAVKVAHA